MTVPTNSTLTIHKQTVLIHPIVDEYHNPSPAHLRSSGFADSQGLADGAGVGEDGGVVGDVVGDGVGDVVGAVVGAVGAVGKGDTVAVRRRSGA